MKNNTDAVKLLKSLGMKVDLSTPGKVMVSSKGKIRRRGRAVQTGSAIEDIASRLNAAKKGTLLHALAEAMRAASQAVGHLPEGDSAGAKAIRREVRRQRQTGIVSAWNQRQLVDRFSELNKILARQSVTIQAMPTVNKPVRLLLAPQSNNRDMASVVKIITASEAGKLDFLKSCAACQRFFIAVRYVDRFCDDRCRGKWHRQQPGSNQKNAEYQKKFREARKALNRGARKALRGD